MRENKGKMQFCLKVTERRIVVRKDKQANLEVTVNRWLSVVTDRDTED